MFYITSDVHLDHERALVFNERPYLTLKDQADSFIAQVNELPDYATLIIVGDMFIGSNREFIASIFEAFKQTIHVIIVLGNHDERHKSYYRTFHVVKQVTHMLRFKHMKQSMTICHYPMTEWYRGQAGEIHLFGHCHGRYEHPGRAIDVGWDNWNWKIQHMDTVIEAALKKPIYQPCHNNNNGTMDKET
jgi:calcineurin-like phosphoesterase family protein